ncbi:MAG: hypothetical protein AAB393_04830, partial [Bacteroidota bacterium]
MKETALVRGTLSQTGGAAQVLTATMSKVAGVVDGQVRPQPQFGPTQGVPVVLLVTLVNVFTTKKT